MTIENDEKVTEFSGDIGVERDKGQEEFVLPPLLTELAQARRAFTKERYVELFNQLFTGIGSKPDIDDERGIAADLPFSEASAAMAALRLPYAEAAAFLSYYLDSILELMLEAGPLEVATTSIKFGVALGLTLAEVGPDAQAEALRVSNEILARGIAETELVETELQARRHAQGGAPTH